MFKFVVFLVIGDGAYMTQQYKATWSTETRRLPLTGPGLEGMSIKASGDMVGGDVAILVGTPANSVECS